MELSKKDIGDFLIDREYFKISANDFEHHGTINLLRRPFMFVCNRLNHKIGHWLFNLGSNNGDTKIVSDNVTTYKALEVMYTFWDRYEKGEVNLSDIFWETNLSNARSIRNRLRLTKFFLKKILEKLNIEKKNINLVSLAAGSARAVIEAISECGFSNVRVKLIDLNADALKYAEGLADSYNISSQIECIEGNIFKLRKLCRNMQIDVVEAVGILDYLSAKQAIFLFSDVLNLLSQDGYLITCNIIPNYEEPFVTKAIGWPLIYRDNQEITELLVASGFEKSNIILTPEPLNIHLIALAKKSF